MALGRIRHNESEGTWGPCLTLGIITFLSCTSVYLLLSPLFHHHHPPPQHRHAVISGHLNGNFTYDDGELKLQSEGGCCKGWQGVELWGDVVKWGSDFIVKSAEDCCRACKATCNNNGSSCKCNAWVFCGDRRQCGSKFGQCWLKRQNNSIALVFSNSPQRFQWTSGLVYEKNEGIIALETQYGSIRIKLLPECAPHSVSYVLQLFASRICAGCQFYRAEKRGNIWDEKGNLISRSSVGPPYALLQGTLEAVGIDFIEIPKESISKIYRGSVAWVNGGPDFFISLANHFEFTNRYTVFANVLEEDMLVVEKIAELPTTSEFWDGVKVAALSKAVPLKLKSPVTVEN